MSEQNNEVQGLNAPQVVDQSGRPLPLAESTLHTAAAPGCAPASLGIDMGTRGLDKLASIHLEPLIGRIDIRYIPHPHSTEGRLEQLERRFEKLLATIIEGESNERCDGNWNKPTGLDYIGSLTAQLTGFKAAMTEMRDSSPIYNNPHPAYGYRPEHWDDGL